MGWLENILNLLRGFDDYGAPNDEEELLGLSANTALSGPPSPREYRSGETIVPWDKSVVPARRDYSGGYKEGFSNGGTFNVAKRNPDWAPNEEEDQLSSILTTSALQSLVTNKRIDPGIANGVAMLKNAATGAREQRDLSKGRRTGGDVAEYLFDLERRGELSTKDRAELAVNALQASRTNYGVDEGLAGAVTEMLGKSTRTPGTDRIVEEAPIGADLPRGLASAPSPRHLVKDPQGNAHHGYLMGEPGWGIEGGKKVKGPDGALYWIVD